MSITTEIKRIQTAKSDIKNVVNKYVPNTITNELLTVYDDRVETAINKYRNACPTNTSEDGKCADALDVPIVNYQIYGNSEQEMPPSPNYPQEIYSLGDKTKNLFDKKGKFDYNNGTHTGNSLTSLQADGTIKTTANFANYRSNGQLLENLKENTTYIVSGTLKESTGALGGGIQILTTTNSIVSTKYPSVGTFSYAFNTGANASVWISINSYGNVDTGATAIYDNIQIEEGSSATEYVPYGYEIPVVVSGKNLFDGSSAGTAGQYLSSDGTIGSGGTNLRYTGLIKMPDGTNDITVSGITAAAPMNLPALCFYDKDQAFISGEAYVNATAKTFSVPNNAVYFATSYRTIYPNFQVETGATVTIYEPYHTPVETTIYLDRPLCKCGDMADWIDYKEGKRHNVIGEIVLDGSEDWADFGYSSEDTNFRCQYDTVIQNILTPPDNPANLLCNYFKAANRDAVYAKTEVGIAQYGGDLGKIFICAPISILDGTNTLAQWKTWLSTHNLEIIYPLGAEIEEDIALPNFTLWNGTNIFTANTSVLPSQVQWQYITNTYSTITQQTDILQDEQTETNDTETINEAVQDTPQTEVE